MPPDSQNEAQRRKMARLMMLSAVVTVLVGILLGALVWPPLYAIAAFALVDLWLARAYTTGRLPVGNNPRLGRPAEGGVTEGVTHVRSQNGDAASAADAAAADPSYNPYARED